MTRITNVGRGKRKWNEAEFNTLFEGDSKQANEDHVEQPRKKKQKYEEYKQLREAKRAAKAAQESTSTGWGRSEEVKANAAASEVRRKKRIQDRMADTTCLACRQKGHTARDCPSNAGGKSSSKPAMGICYRCGSSKHTLSKCKKPVDSANPLPFAHCFVCKGQGHLASTCSKNEKGVYPNGGSCKLCNQTTHLAKDCPLRSKAPPAEGVLLSANVEGDAPGPDEDDFMVFKRKSNQLGAEEKHEKTKGTSAPKKKTKVVSF